MKRGRIFRVILVVLAALTIGTSLVSAQTFDYMDSFTLTPGGEPVGGKSGRYNQLTDIVNTIVQPVFVIAGFIFFFTLVFNGVKMATNPGNKQVLENAKKYITFSLVGLIIMFCAFWVVQFVKTVTIGETDIDVAQELEV